MAVNGYIDENGVFVNKFGITDPETLHEVEYQITARQARDWAERKPHTDIGFGLTRLQTIHAHLMGEIYAWAGKIRTVPSRKRGSFASVTEFANPSAIESDWQELEKTVSTFLANDQTQFDSNLEQLADIFIAANQIHSFPEGNGRSLQVFMRDLANEMEIELDYSNVSREEWNHACSVSGNHGKLFERQIFMPSPRDDTKIKSLFKRMARTLKSNYCESNTPTENASPSVPVKKT